jgi:hypothetical protein
VEAKIHERPGGAGPAVLLLPWGPGAPPHGPGGQALVCTVDGRTQDRLRRYAEILGICSVPGVLSWTKISNTDSDVLSWPQIWSDGLRHAQMDLDMQN